MCDCHLPFKGVEILETGNYSGHDTETDTLFSWNWNNVTNGPNQTYTYDGFTCTECYAYFTLTLALIIYSSITYKFARLW
jgi:hypothetical protein